ncbi:MAG: hypothetical protein D6776_09125 [Planctomycetota bacterium]|nr:MAG: hypothetical protein D6776_09125 [Planctomycetota bacterium]
MGVDPAQIEAIRERSEALRTELETERYETISGRKLGSDLSAIYARYRDLEQPETRARIEQRLAELEAESEADATPESAEKRQIERDRLQWLLAELVERRIESETKALTDDLVRREQAAVLDVGGPEPLPLREAEFALSLERSRPRRERIEAAQLAAIAEQLNPLYAERLGIERGLARALGHRSFAGLWQALHGIELQPLHEQMQRFLEATDDMYRETMGWYVRKHAGLALEDAARHDMLALFHGHRWESAFPRGDMVRTATRFLAEMGLEPLAGGRIELDLEPRERKALRAYCVPIRVPQRVVVVSRPEGGRRDWRRLLHELGMALHYAYTDPEAPYEVRCLGDPSLRESYGFLLQYRLADRSWLRRYLSLSRPRDYLFEVALEKLAYLRRYSAQLAYELELRSDAPLDLDEAAERYEAHMRRALVFGYPRALALRDVATSFESARYLRAWLFEALLSKHLVHYFDEDWYRNPRCGAFIRRQWALGGRYRVESMVQQLGYETLSTEPIERELLQAL